jgi:hypothetical protein
MARNSARVAGGGVCGHGLLCTRPACRAFPQSAERLELRPCTITDAKRFVGRFHRHSAAPPSALFAVGVGNPDLCGVALVGRPIARRLQDGWTAEILRVCTRGERNACSMLYGAAVRACRALGYRRVLTYTLQSESGASLRATGAREEPATVRLDQSWDVPSRRREDFDLFGPTKRPREPKVRWMWTLR